MVLMPTKILSSALSPFGARLRIAVAFKQLDITFDLPPGGAGSADMKQLTPFGRIPALITDNAVLVESLALLDYLEDAYPGTRSLRPVDAVTLARARMLAQLFDHNVIKALGGVFTQIRSATPDAALARESLDAAEAELHKLVTLFDPEGPAVGGAVSIADCAMLPFAQLMNMLAPLYDASSPTMRVPRFAAWWAELSQLPEVAQVTGNMGTMFATLFGPKKPA